MWYILCDFHIRLRTIEWERESQYIDLEAIVEEWKFLMRHNDALAIVLLNRQYHQMYRIERFKHAHSPFPYAVYPFQKLFSIHNLFAWHSFTHKSNYTKYLCM